MIQKITPAGPRPSPAKMLSEMSNRTTLIWIGVALLIHVVVSAPPRSATCVPHWGSARPKRNPPTPTYRQAPRLRPPRCRPPRPRPPRRTPTPGFSTRPRCWKSTRASPVVKSITETAKPENLPKAPSPTALVLDSLDGK